MDISKKRLALQFKDDDILYFKYQVIVKGFILRMKHNKGNFINPH
jgi:hypothetical protein